MTSNSIGWVLPGGASADATTLDHDYFDVVDGATVDGDIAERQSAVRGALAITAASGHQVNSIALTWTDDVGAKAALLLKALPDMGFRSIVTVPLPESARLWAGPTIGPSASTGARSVWVIALFAVGPELAGQSELVPEKRPAAGHFACAESGPPEPISVVLSPLFGGLP